MLDADQAPSVGLLDLPAPLFAWVDGLLGGFASPTLRLVLWGLIGAAISMGVYWLLSPQERIARAKAEAVAARRALDTYDGDFGQAGPLMRRALGTAVGQLGLVAWPALVGSLPVLALLAWLSTAYGHTLPATRADVAASVSSEPLEARVVSAPAADAPERQIVVVLDQRGRAVQRFSLSAPVPVIHKRKWWNVLIGNPIGYLPANGPLGRIELDMPYRQYLPIGPDWLRAWYVVFFGSLLGGSVAIKGAARIQ